EGSDAIANGCEAVLERLSLDADGLADPEACGFEADGEVLHARAYGLVGQAHGAFEVLADLRPTGVHFTGHVLRRGRQLLGDVAAALDDLSNDAGAGGGDLLAKGAAAA